MKLVAALVALAALVASASATCWCPNGFLDFNPSTTSCNVATASDYQPGYTYTYGATIDTTSQIKCDPLYGVYPNPVKTHIADLAANCNNLANCVAFGITPFNGGLKVCYFSSTTILPGTTSPDKRCMGTWVRTGPLCTCDKYGVGSGAYWKCLDCQRNTNAGDLCCSCPKTTNSDPTNCVDCVATANPADRAACAGCGTYYADGTNGLTRCWECVKQANNAAAFSAVFASGKKWEVCHKFCAMKPAPAFAGMNDPSQCLGCVQNNLAQYFMQVPGNPNGQCPSGGRRRMV